MKSIDQRVNKLQECGGFLLNQLTTQTANELTRNLTALIQKLVLTPLANSPVPKSPLISVGWVVALFAE